MFNGRVLSAFWLSIHGMSWRHIPHPFAGYFSTLLQIIPADLLGYLIIPSRSIPTFPPR